MPATTNEADTWRELLFELIRVLPQLAEPERWPLDERLRAYDVLTRALEAEANWHEARRRLPLPGQRSPLVIDLTDITAPTGGTA